MSTYWRPFSISCIYGPTNSEQNSQTVPTPVVVSSITEDFSALFPVATPHWCDFAFCMLMLCPHGLKGLHYLAHVFQSNNQKSSQRTSTLNILPMVVSGVLQTLCRCYIHIAWDNYHRGCNHNTTTTTTGAATETSQNGFLVYHPFEFLETAQATGTLKWPMTISK